MNKDCKLDFSEFHTLEHPWFSRDCRSQYGGIKRHLSLWWEYKAYFNIRMQTTCRLGYHSYVEVHYRKEASTEYDLVYRACHYCWKSK